MSGGSETLEFQAETRQLLHLVVHSLYSNKDIFLRELVSNASDALDKLRLESLKDPDLAADTGDLHIEIEADVAARTLTVRDNGIGMTRDEVVDLIGTIAKSGTASLLEKLKQAKDSAASNTLIGQFGVGFYSAFMVADKVTLVTRRAGEEHGTRWESTGESTYEIERLEDAPQGTSVTLALKPVDTEDHLYDYAAEFKIKEIVKRYSDFIRWPIRLAGQADPVNSMKALWARPRNEIAQTEYHEFYKQLAHDWADPLETIHFRAEGTFEYDALLFLPAQAPFDLYTREAKRGVQLYVNRVFIMDECDALMPQYLRFVKGVVDAHDLSLNVSRELLQHDRQIRGVRRRLVSRVLSTAKGLLEKEPEKYRGLWDAFGRALKEGLLEDADNQAALLDLLLLETTHDAAEPTTLRAYAERMKPEQTEIYYLTGANRAAVENSPHMEAFKAKGYEVLILTDPIDEVWVDQAPAYDGKTLRSVAKGQVDLDAAESDEGGDKQQAREEFAPLLEFLAEALADKVKSARLSTRLTDSPACLVGDTNDLTPALEKLYRAMGQPVPHTKRILEVNAAHPLITGLRAAQAGDAAARADGQLEQSAELLYGLALLAEGGELEDPARFSRLIADRLAPTV
ncbi:molecular chaperone HtpG [Actinospica durhamensis]|uniref:Chaperone protein HtpG n=1 Tax=Actinospica durhamensis TaxID=1508375 RepID=A0A941EVA7_9ACTN|nr:molecular chaperone HtpG [Actinospica durhamensis]MBR7838405.1 molecular chaperone HtpG [Actinospica durhamensis]